MYMYGRVFIYRDRGDICVVVWDAHGFLEICISV